MATTVTAVASAVAAKIAISQTMTVASTADSLARQVATALETQNSLNEHICQGIFQLNIQTSLLQEQLDFLWDLHVVSFSPSFHHICAMPGPVRNLSATVSQVNAMAHAIS